MLGLASCSILITLVLRYLASSWRRYLPLAHRFLPGVVGDLGWEGKSRRVIGT